MNDCLRHDEHQIGVFVSSDRPFLLFITVSIKHTAVDVVVVVLCVMFVLFVSILKCAHIRLV